MSFAIEGTLFEPGLRAVSDFKETNGLASVRYCQRGLDGLAERVIRGGGLCPDLYPEGIGNCLGAGKLEQALRTCRELDAKNSAECRTYCFKGILGNCPFANLDAKGDGEDSIGMVANALTGPKKNSFYAHGGTGGWTTPGLQSIRTVLNRTVLPGGNPVANMNTAKKQHVIDHFADMGLAPQQLILDL